MITRTTLFVFLTSFRWPIALCLVFVVAWADYLTGAFVTLSAFYLAPLLLIAWREPRWQQQLMIGLIITVWSLANIYSAPANYTLGVVVWNALVRWLHLTLTAELFHRIILINDMHKNAAEHDTLTGLYNRRGFTAKLHIQQETYRQSAKHLAFAMVDIDFFKQINDQHGHQFGDKVLQGVANSIALNSNALEFSGRLGGDEFAFIWYADSQDELKQRLKSLSTLLNDQATPCSIGAVIYHAEQVPWLELYEEADKALYQSKLHGRNQVFIPDTSAATAL